MKIVTQSSPTILQPGKASASANDARSRAIAALTGQSTQPAAAAAPTPSPTVNSPVSNPTKIAPEEMGAIAQTSTQNNTSEASASQASEPAAPAKAPETPVEDPRLAQLARKERAIQIQARQLKQRELEMSNKLADMEKSFEAKLIEVQRSAENSIRSRLKEDPFTVLGEEGLSYDALTQQALNAPRPEQVEMQRTIREQNAKIAELEARHEKTDNAIKEQQTTAYKQAIGQIKNEAQRLVNNDANFETIKESKQVGEVVRLIEKTFNDDGYLMSVEEACQAVEDELVSRAVKLAGLKKIQQRLQPAPAPKPVEQPAASNAAQTKQQPSTLTNSMTSSKKLSAKERAILAFNGQLKN